jgi:hypothetical protein
MPTNIEYVNIVSDDSPFDFTTARPPTVVRDPGGAATGAGGDVAGAPTVVRDPGSAASGPGGDVAGASTVEDFASPVSVAAPVDDTKRLETLT